MKRLIILGFLKIIFAVPLFGSSLLLDINSLNFLEKIKNLPLIGTFLLILIIVIVLISNIIQKKIILRKLEKRDALLHRISNNLVNGFIYQVDAGKDNSYRKFTYISKNVFLLIGKTDQQIYKDPNELYGLLHPEDFTKLKEEEYKAFINKSILSFEGRIILENGTMKWFQLTSIPHIAENGHILWDGLASDIVRLKNIENDLIIAKNKAEESANMITSFLSNLSHEIRTPMNGIVGYMELLKSQNIPEVNQILNLKNFKSSSLRLLSTLDDLLLMSEIEAGISKINISKSNISYLLDQIFVTFQNEADQKGLILTLTKPDSYESDIIETDKDKLIIIFSKLIQNSIKFTHEGSIEFGYFLEDLQYHFFVKDSGKGISNEALEVVFKTFVQENMKPNREYEGIGIGLSIAKALVEKLGGKIWIESVENSYSTFHFTLK